MDPKVDMIDTQIWWAKHFNLITGIVSGFASIITFIIVILAWNWSNLGLIFALIFVWAFLPPLSFWLEFFYIFRKYGKPDTLELFKHGQQVKGAIWAGMVVALVSVASSDHFKTQPVPPLPIVPLSTTPPAFELEPKKFNPPATPPKEPTVNPGAPKKIPGLSP